MNRSTVQSFLQQTLPDYQKHHAMPFYQLKAASQLMACRTQALGGHAVYCEDGHLNGVWYNSCRHRSCPQCSALKSAQWLQKAEAILLKCQHHHWVFTLTHDLHTIWRYNREFCQQLFFKSVRETLQKLSKDARYLAAIPAYFLALHTWARNQTFHPHVHCLISHGGLDDTGNWQAPKRKCFLPAKVMMQIFRGKYLDGLKKALAAGTLVIPANQSAQQVRNLCNKLGRQDWVVHCVKPYEHGTGIAKYLARYIRGGAIKNSQIIHVGKEKVKFRYRSHQKQKTEYLNLTHEKFMQRLLSHIAIPNKPQYQLLGLYHGRCRDKLNAAREALGQETVSKDDMLNWQDFIEQQGQRECCKQCGKALTQLRALGGEELAQLAQLALRVIH